MAIGAHPINLLSCCLGCHGNDDESRTCSYKAAFGQLKTLKSEIEHLQHYLERSKVQLMKDFELWWAEQMSLQQTALQTSTDIKYAAIPAI